jgi:predicted GIY-YIG superfamily endonuclease
MSSNEWSVYQLFDETMDLLYVGIAKDVSERVQHHVKHRSWGREISQHTVTKTKLTKRDALGLESELIRQSQPKHNVLHNHRDEPPPTAEKLTSKERFQRWYAEFAMKHWYSFSFFEDDGGQQVEIPVFALEQGNFSVFSWTSKDGNQSIEVRPSLKGRAAIHDKDLLIYLLAQLVNGERSGRRKSESRSMRIDVHNYLMSTQKLAGRGAHANLIAALDRLRDTTVVRKIKIGGTTSQLEFGIIESWAVTDSDAVQVPITIDITVSDWVFQIFRQGKFFEIPYGYFQARSPIVRRVHELVGPHCAVNGSWTGNLDELLEIANPDNEKVRWHFPWITLFGTQTLPGFRVNWDSINRVARLRPKYS